MSFKQILTVALTEEADIVSARQRARQIAAEIGFEGQDQTRIATAVSEIARNALSYGLGGRIEFTVVQSPKPSLQIVVRDNGPGIVDVDAILEGRFKSQHGMGVGISGARRLMDDFSIQSSPDLGTAITLRKTLPKNARKITNAIIADLGRVLAATGALDPLMEVKKQNQELLQSLAALAIKQDEAARLNAELETTNRGVVALYAELDKKAVELSALNDQLERRVGEAVLECNRINDALRQSQKMEAVGQLTGGIAHDFNNLLQIVTGNLDMLIRRLPKDEVKWLKAAESAMSGALRAATLTQRLLAFSRRQPLAPKPFDPNKLVDNMFELMHRTLGEQINIETKLASDLWTIEADANQLENALLNLAVNARDAMSSGGKLTISTTNCVIGENDAAEDVAPGQYVTLAVRDRGSGMSEDVLARAFEPFFTTKDVGKGTGLGLSMVYGFVKQSGGHLRIESSLGRGTTVSLYLPRFYGKISANMVLVDAAVQSAKDGEVILVVEDDADVRLFTCEVLIDLGYKVLSAIDGNSAIETMDGNERISLLFTDVVLTGALTGRDVANHAKRSRPNMPVLFTSGYARDAIMHNHRLDEDIELLSKPFSYEDLAARIRSCLDRRSVHK